MNTTNDPEDATADAKTSAAVVADLVSKHVRPRLMELESPDLDHKIPLLVLPRALAVQGIEKFVEPYLDAPKRRKGTAKLVDLVSFISLVNRFKDDDSALFAEPEKPQLLAMLDYNERNPRNDAGELTGVGSPRFGQHRAVYTFPLSDEWKAWNERNGKWMKQIEFAEFLDDRILDVGALTSEFPRAAEFLKTLGISQFASPSRLMELSRGLTVHIEDQTTCRVDPSSGETLMNFTVQNRDEAGAQLAVPRAFLLQIPVFREGDAYRFPVRLKYRAGSGSVMWSYEIHEPRRAFDDAFRIACASAEERTALPLFYGSPEA